MRQGAQLSVMQLVMLALGTSVGGSFFLGTSIALRSAGAGTLIAFAVAGLLAYIVLMALSEMAVARPTHGSFREYAEVAFGPMAGFVVGWVYWTGLVLALSSEATAAALFTRVWLPGVPLWMVSLAIIAGVTLLNLVDLRLFAAVESVMSGAKLLAIAAFVVLIGSMLLGLLPGRPPAGGMAALTAQPLLPRGLGGLGGSMLIVLFAYAGFEVVGLAAPDAKDPARTIPRAVVLTVVALVTLFIATMAVLVPVLPLSAVSTEESPMVTALRLVGHPGLSAGLNAVVMSASLSTMLAATYGLGRMLYSLAEEGQAPAIFKRLTPTGAPRLATLASGAAMLVGVVLAFLLPKRVYIFLVSSGGFSLLFAYLIILASQLVIRRREGCRVGSCQLPGYPYSTWLGIVLLILSMAAMPFVPGQGAGLLAGIGLVVLFSAAYLLRGRAQAGGGPGGGKPVDTVEADAPNDPGLPV